MRGAISRHKFARRGGELYRPKGGLSVSDHRATTRRSFLRTTAVARRADRIAIFLLRCMSPLMARMRPVSYADQCPLFGVVRTQRGHRLWAVFVKVFGCRPLTDGAAHSGGRRTKTSKGGNRGREAANRAARSTMGI